MTIATARRQCFTELQGGATPKETRNFLIRYCILSVVIVVVLHLELRKENSDSFSSLAALFCDQQVLVLPAPGHHFW